MALTLSRSFSSLRIMEKESIEKLTETLYRVTERMDDREALKWNLRERALELGDIYRKTERDLTIRDEENRARALASIISMLELASSTTYVARINFDVLVREYRLLNEEKKEEKSEKEEPLVRIRYASLGGDKIVVMPSPAEFEKNEILMPQERGDGQAERQKRILACLENGNSISIGELMQIFGSQVSEKTIQRDLNDLMIRGSVKAAGDKRWRKYSIIAS